MLYAFSPLLTSLLKELQKKSLLRERMTSRILKSLPLSLSPTITKGQEYDHKQLDFMKSSLGHQKVKQQKRLANTDAYSHPSTPGSLPKSPESTGPPGNLSLRLVLPEVNTPNSRTVRRGPRTWKKSALTATTVKSGDESEIGQGHQLPVPCPVTPKAWPRHPQADKF